jgi:ATP-dependent Lon protease
MQPPDPEPRCEPGGVPVSPMFPLGSVLVPGMILPLHVFEPRYRALVRDCTAGDGEFGVVLIERGSEVGGGDARTDVGTMARIVQADELPDGRYAVGAVGMRRIRITAWLADEPYPRAEVVDWPDATDDGDPVGEGAVAPPASTTALVEEVEGLLRRVGALRTELGEPAPPLDVTLADDPLIAGYQATALAPLGPLDKQALLAAPSVRARLDDVRRLLGEHVELLQARLAGG